MRLGIVIPILHAAGAAWGEVQKRGHRDDGAGDIVLSYVSLNAHVTSRHHLESIDRDRAPDHSGRHCFEDDEIGAADPCVVEVN